MPIFTIVFERRSQAGDHDYQPLMKELQAQKCFPLWEESWLGSFNNNATQVHNYFKKLMAAADRIAVFEMTNHFCYSGVVQGANKWLELNPPAGGIEGASEPEPVAPAKPAAAKAPAKKPASRKAPARKAPAKQAAASKAPAKKAPAKKAPAKTAAASKASKPPAKKPAAKASAAKAPAKPAAKAPASKPAAKRSAAKPAANKGGK